MDFVHLLRLRSERLIAAGRVVLAASSLFAVWLDPSEPAKYASLAYGLLAGYLAYAVLIALLAWRADLSSRSWQIGTHALDLVLFSLFIYFTQGPASPFTAYFVFALLCATLRWQSPGTLWTAAVALGAFLGMGFYFGEVRQDPAFQLNGFIIRAVYLGVVAVLLGYLGAHEQQTRRELSLLAAWPERVWTEAEPFFRAVLGHAAAVLGVSRVLLVWRPDDDPALHLALWDGGDLMYHREPGATDRELVVEALASASFMCSDVQQVVPTVRVQSHAGLSDWQGHPLSSEFAMRFSIRAVLAVRLAGEVFRGRLFFLDKAAMTIDHLVLGQILADAVSTRLDHFYLMQQLQQAAATEERIRLARDLHDGVLQSFTGVALRLAAVRRLLDTDPAKAVEGLEEARRLIAAEQKDLRFFIDELKPSGHGALGGGESLLGRLSRLGERMEREWDLHVNVDLHTGGLEELVAEPVSRDIYHIVREALVNAVRHGEASEAHVTIDVKGRAAIGITVEDNGRGFPASGEEASHLVMGPRSLRERIHSRHGVLTVQSSPSGVRLVVVLPLNGD